MVSDEFHLRLATASDQALLVDMLVEAVNWWPERQLSEEDVVTNPDLAHYIDGWPRPNDIGVVAEANGQSIGAAWLRYYTHEDPGYGYVGDDIPELTMAVVASWRSRGVGRALVQQLADEARSVGIRSISLSVERANFAHQLYTSEGYRLVARGDNSDTMIKELQPDP